MLKKKIWAKVMEGENKGYILYVEYSLWGVILYRKEKHKEFASINYSDF